MHMVRDFQRKKYNGREIRETFRATGFTAVAMPEGPEHASNRKILQTKVSWYAACSYRGTSQIENRARFMLAPHLDILKRQKDGSFVWIEAKSDMQAAEERIAELAATEPGEYFVFNQRTQQIAAKIAKQPMG